MASGKSWEREVASYLRSLDFKSEVRAERRGHEIDVYAERGRTTLVTECKDWERAVSKDPVRTVNNNASELGAEPVIAYTSSLSSGARELAEDYGVVPLPAEIVRDQKTTVETARRAAQDGSIVHSEASEFAELDQTLGPFTVTDDFARSVAEDAVNQSFYASMRGESEVTDRIQDEVSKIGSRKCVPVLSEDGTTIELYGIGPSEHEILPRKVERRTVDLD